MSDGISDLGMGDVLAARRRVAPFSCSTPTVTHPLLSRELGAQVWVKLENTQALGAFKIRGGLNLVAALSPAQRRRGLVAATRGNHGQSLAHAARMHGVDCTLVVPEGNNPDKNEAMESLGARVVEQGTSFDEACEVAAAWAGRSGARLVHPGKEAALIAGVGTLALEMLEQVPVDLDVLFVPVGVGSCIVGAGLVFAALSPRTRIVGVGAASAPAMARAFTTGRLDVIAPGPTLADGLAVGTPIPDTLGLMHRYVHSVRLVSEDQIREAIVIYARTLHQLAEGAGAAALAGAIAMKNALVGQRVGLILSGGNIDRRTLRRVLDEPGVAQTG